MLNISNLIFCGSYFFLLLRSRVYSYIKKKLYLCNENDTRIAHELEKELLLEISNTKKYNYQKIYFMKHRFTLLFALLCASMMTWAVDQDTWIGGNDNYANQFKWYAIDDVTTPMEVVNIQSKDGYDVIFVNVGQADFDRETGIVGCEAITDAGAGVWIKISSLSLIYNDIYFKNSVGTILRGLRIYNAKGTGKSVPTLTVNQMEVTIDASTSETFAITVTYDGDGAVSYESNNEGIATVSDAGVITAKGRGTAIVTIKAPETENYAEVTKKITVNVTGPINWEAIAWLTNSNEQYKLHISPEIVDAYGRKKIEGTNLWVGFPSAVFGDCSIPYSAVGAGVSFALTNFSKQENTFTMVCAGTTYTFTVYNDNGEPEDLTGWNIAKGKTSVAGHYPNENRRPSLANDGKIEDGDSRWASDGAKHYAAEGENAEDWWYVDLGDFYSIKTIKILFETASPTDYDLLISNNALTWTVIGTYAEAPKTGNSAEQYNVYEFSGKVGRYVKIFARNGYSNLAYGFSMYEFEVYGERASVSDVTPPTMGTVSLSGTPTYDKISIAVSATDTEDGMVSSFHVVDETNGINQSCEAVDGVITVTGLNENITYNFIITAVDAAGNESENAATIQASTTIDNTIPQSNAAVPTATNKDVLPIYSDAFASILAHSFDKDGWAGVALYKEKNIGGDSYLLYNIASANEIIWGMYDDGANAIIAAEEYRAEGHMGVDASAMEYLHIDLWSKQACNIGICINDQSLKNQVAHTGSGWQGFDIPLSEFNVDADVNKQTNNVRWFKFNNLVSITGKVAIDNVYFWKNATGMVSLSAGVNDAAMGSATVKQGGEEVTEVATGSEVTFSAVANDGYVFVEWSNGEKNATFTTTVDAALNLTATFRKLGTTYCNTLVQSTNGGQEHDAYVTMKRTAENEYTLVVRSAEAMLNFGGVNFYMQPNTHVIDLRNQGTLSADKRTLIATFSAEKEPYMTTPLYVVLDGGFEAYFPQLTNIEYTVSCEDNVEVESIALEPAETTIEVGGFKTLVPIFTPAYAVNQIVSWSSNDESIVSVSSDGVIGGNAVGDAIITATSANGKTATCNVTVNTISEKTWWGLTTIAGWDNMPILWSITRNIDKTLTYTVYFGGDASGKVMQINNGGYNTLTGYTDSERKASFTTTTTYESGTQIKPDHFFFFGGPRIELANEYIVGASNEKPITSVESVVISHSTASLMKDETIQLVASVVPSFADDKTLVWSSDDTNIATVDNNGLVTAVAEGATTITATSNNGKTASCVVTVVGALEPATWYGTAVFEVKGNPVAVNYSITRTSDRTLTYRTVLSETLTGIFMQLNDGEYRPMTQDATGRIAEWTSTNTYEDGATHSMFFYPEFEGGANRWDVVNYIVGSSNEKPNTLVAFGDQADNTAKIAEYANEVVDAYINRTFPNTDEWYTLCLPFDMDESQLAATFGAGYTLATLGNSEDRGSLIHLNFNYVNTLEAGKPYLLKPGVSTVTVPMIEAVTIKNVDPSAAPQKAESAHMHFQGTFAPTTLEGDNKRFVGPNNYLYSPAEGGTNMKSFRCYFTIPVESQALVGSKAARIVLGPQVATGTENVQRDEAQSTKVIIDGTLYIIRGERTYNAQGQLVK